MREYSYTLVVDDIHASERYYNKYFGWESEDKNDYFMNIDTKSPLRFSVVQKEYILNNLNIGEAEIPTCSFCTWIYSSEEEMICEKKELLNKGLKQIGSIGNFLMDESGIIWELRQEGGML